MNQPRHILVYLGFSFIAVVLVGLLVVTAPAVPPVLTRIEKMCVTGVFILCCAAGISFSIRPNWVRRYFSQKKNSEEEKIEKKNRLFQGHHPDCLTFQGHTIHWRNATWCAGCLGLLIGSCASIVVMTLYIITDFTLQKMILYLLMVLGLFFVFFVFIEIIQRSKHPWFHVFSNSLLLPGFLLITISIMGLTGTLVYGLFTILLCFLWLDTRVQLSQWRHRTLCRKCPESCKMFSISG